MGLANLFKRKKAGPSDLEKKILLCKGYTNLWREFFEKHFSDTLEEIAVTDEREAAFFKIMTVLATRHFEFAAKMGDDFKDPDRLLTFLGEVVSLANLHTMSEAEFSALQVRWHELFIELNKALGRLLQQMPLPAKDAKPAAAAPAAAAK